MAKLRTRPPKTGACLLRHIRTPSRRPARLLIGAAWLLSFAGGTVFATEPEMVFIPGGEFLRGRSHALPDDGLKWRPNLLKDDRPVRRIRLEPYYLGKHEVTNGQYLGFLEAAGGKPPFHWIRGKLPSGEENHPIANVSWSEAATYCEWAGKRLPTEAEWERAARGMAEGATYPWGEEKPTDKLARFDVLEGPGPVCEFGKNYFGLCDMAGNVWEWCSDRYERRYYEHSAAENPRGSEQGMYRVLRGGSWADAPKYLTCAYRSFARPRAQSPNIGFRCAKNFR